MKNFNLTVLALILVLAACSPRTSDTASEEATAPAIEDYNPLFTASVAGKNLPFNAEENAWIYNTQAHTIQVSFSPPETLSPLDESDTGPLGFVVSVRNKSANVLRILWEESNYIDSEGNAQRLYVRDLINDIMDPPSARERTGVQQPTSVPPGAIGTEIVAPAGYQLDILGDALLISVVSQEELEAGNAQQGLFLTLGSNGQRQGVSFSFRQK